MDRGALQVEEGQHHVITRTLRATQFLMNKKALRGDFAHDVMTNRARKRNHSYPPSGGSKYVSLRVIRVPTDPSICESAHSASNSK